MKIHTLIIVCFMLLISFSVEAIAGPKYPEHFITYEVKEDSITVYRHYPKRVKVDTVTMNPVASEYFVLKPITFNYKDSALFDSMQIAIDSFNQRMVDNHVYAKIAPINLVVEESVLFETFFMEVIKPIAEKEIEAATPFSDHKERVFVLDENSFIVSNNIFEASSPVISFEKEHAYLIHDLYGYKELFSKAAIREFDSLHHAIDKAVEKNFYHSIRRQHVNNKVPGYFVNARGASITVRHIVEMLSEIDMFSQFTFIFDRNFKVIRHRGRGFGNNESEKNAAYINITPNKEKNISFTIDKKYFFTGKYPYKDPAPVFKNLSDTTKSPYASMSYWRNSIEINWDGVNNPLQTFTSGFVVAKYDLIPFLEEKLKIMGLDVEERSKIREDWVRDMAKHEFTLIHFATEEYEKANPMKISPKPDTKIRFIMRFKEVDSTFKIKEQVITPVERKGFTIVDWLVFDCDVE